MLDAGNFAFLFARRESCLAVWSATQVVSSRHASRGAHPLGAGQALEGMPCLTVSDRSWAFEQQGLSISWGFQTEVFNILGPLTNPAKPDGMVCGVFTASLGRLFVEVFKLLGEPLRNFVEPWLRRYEASPGGAWLRGPRRALHCRALSGHAFSTLE